jgi:hypothetical protein
MNAKLKKIAVGLSGISLSIMPLDFGLINGLILLKIRKKLTI